MADDSEEALITRTVPVWDYNEDPPMGVIAERPEESDPEDPATLSRLEKIRKEGLQRGHEDGEEEKPLTLNMPPDRSSPASTEDNLSPKTPAEKVRFLLSDNKDENDNGEHAALLGDNVADIPLAIHALFCQMDVLCHFEDGESGWKEAARWLKYEEKVESGNRWSKPHVATTSLHAIMEVKKGIKEQSVYLELPSPHGCLHQVAENLSSAIAADRGLNESQEAQLLDLLLRPHKHRHRKGQKTSKDKDSAAPTAATQETKFGTSISTTSTSTPKKNAFDTSKNGNTSGEKLLNDSTTKKSRNPLKGKLKMKRLPEDTSDVSALYHTYPGGILPDKLLPYKPNKRLMGKIPGGSEAANILIGQVDFLTEPLYAFARLTKPSILADLTEVAIPTRFIFVVLGPTRGHSVWDLVETGRAMAALLTDAVFCEVAYKAISREDLVVGVEEYMDDLTVLPPSIWDPTTRLEPPEKTISIEKIRGRLLDSSRNAAAPEAFHFAESAGEDATLKRTGRFCGGLIDDIKRKLPWYLSDYRDGLHLQCLASILFIYFACITPVVTFGGLLGHATDNYMGIMETMLAASICGLVYHLFAGQPLSIVGATGPLLVFESILYNFCKDNEWDFLSFRVWIGIWVMLILLVLVAFDLSAFVRYVTRFTEESFAVLISLIFIVESFKKLAHIWDTHPIHIHSVTEDDQFKCHCEHAPYNDSLLAEEDSTVVMPSFSNASLPSYAAAANSSDYHPRDHAIFQYLNWSSLVSPLPDNLAKYEDCITYQHRIVVGSGCITERDCLEHGWILVGPACNVHTVTHSVPDVFFLCSFLFIGTFVIAIFFRNLRTGPFFPSIVRGTVSDFAVLIAILCCTFIDYFIGIDTPKLTVPTEFKNTRADRTWLVNPLDITHWWLPLAALIPGVLCTILVFLDQQITAVIVNRKEHKLKKGHGYHLDLFVLAILVGTCSLLGLPWFVAATVRAVTHVRSLIRESELKVPGERPQFLGVREQRLTGVVIHILIGVSVFLTPILQHIPMAILYGVFLYMGVTSLSGVQFVQRLMLLLMPGKYQPDYIYLRHVTAKRVHIFTFIQLLCMLVMWVTKSIKKISILFPLMILALCFIRKAMDYYFTQSELYWLDHLLPDEERREKEDKEEATAIDDAAALKAAEADGGYFERNLMMEEDLPPMKGQWNQLIAERDYGVGRKVRPRRLSSEVINRYNRPRGRPSAGFQPGDSTIPEDAISEEGSDTQPSKHTVYRVMPFRERKFSI